MLATTRVKRSVRDDIYAILVRRRGSCDHDELIRELCIINHSIDDSARGINELIDAGVIHETSLRDIFLVDPPSYLKPVEVALSVLFSQDAMHRPMGVDRFMYEMEGRKVGVSQAQDTLSYLISSGQVTETEVGDLVLTPRCPASPSEGK